MKKLGKYLLEVLLTFLFMTVGMIALMLLMVFAMWDFTDHGYLGEGTISMLRLFIVFSFIMPLIFEIRFEMKSSKYLL